MTWMSDGMKISRHCQLSSIDLLKEETQIEFVVLRSALDKAGGRMFLQNTSKHLPDYTVSQPRRLHYEYVI